MGSESVGVVDAIGRGCDDVKIGQRVISVGEGNMAEFVVADAKRVLAAPEAVSVSTAAQMITNPLTALLLVTNQLESSRVSGCCKRRQVRRWEDGSAAWDCLGFKTINVVRRRAGVEEIRALGQRSDLHRGRRLRQACHRDRWSGRRVKGN